MVVLLDIDEDDVEKPSIDEQYRRRHLQGETSQAEQATAASSPENDRVNPNVGGFSAALACYPVVSILAQYLDLNTLHDLSTTCRQIHANLSQYRPQIVKQTLRCVNDDVDTGIQPGGLGQLRNHLSNGSNTSRAWEGRLTSGKVSRCARDLVGECRRCGTVVCRNCTIKYPPPSTFLGRHRRLCRTCTKCPIIYHTTDIEPQSHTPEIPFTTPAFSRGSCTCPDSVYLCLSCGNAIRSSDLTYIRGWTWRTRYSTLFGLGTGIGEGNEGVECGRGADCLEAREVEKEIDCDADELAELRREMSRVELEGGGRSWGGNSYLTHEMEGIGGVVKKKVKKRIKVGCVVKEYEDEREGGTYLEREQKGANRSWCYWCLRVVPGNKDRGGEDAAEDESESASSSPGSVQHRDVDADAAGQQNGSANSSPRSWRRASSLGGCLQTRVAS